ncbi:WhiB family transcriptional regulator [Nocardia sp. NPDC004711]
MTERMFLAWAHCRRSGVPMEQFFPTLPIGDDRDELTAPLRQRCAEQCPVQSACAADALMRGQLHGVVASIDLGPGKVPRPDAVTALHRIAGQVTSY